jgi:hypothetical protein
MPMSNWIPPLIHFFSAVAFGWAWHVLRDKVWLVGWE